MNVVPITSAYARPGCSVCGRSVCDGACPVNLCRHGVPNGRESYWKPNPRITTPSPLTCHDCDREATR